MKEKEIIKKLQISPESFLPLVLSIKFGGDWGIKTNSINVMAIKEKITRYDDNENLGYTLENVFLFLNPSILDQEGEVYRLEKCGNKKERELVKRPFKVVIDAEFIIRAVLDPMMKKIILKKIKGPLTFKGSTAYGISHEMDHICETEIHEKPIWDFEFILDK
ncbi:MAG: hypothetical protein FJ150_06110 [Euryarchaeota archaeon]|nr:hypothetical protein [Euryarchaeota archaeon]